MLKTRNIVINKLQAEDAAELSLLMVSNKKQFQRYFPITLSQNMTEEGSKAYILLKQIEIKLKTEFTYAIRENQNQKVAGLLILKKINWDKKEGELAYCIGQEFAGKGWMTHAVRKISSLAHIELKLKTLQIIVHHTNKASIRVAEKCGYLWRKTLEKEHRPPGEEALDMELYELRTSTY